MNKLPENYAICARFTAIFVAGNIIITILFHGGNYRFFRVFTVAVEIYVY